MDFGLFDFPLLPPEINSTRIYSGPGSTPLMTAAAAWEKLATQLQSTAAFYSSAISALISQPWQGPASASMAAAAARYAGWLTTTAAQAEQVAAQAGAAASAYEAAFAMTVPPAVVAQNRAQLASLIATNILGQNTPAIAATEAQYSEMWAQDVAAMESYASSSAAASKFTPFTTPPGTVNSAGVVRQAAAVAQAAAPAALGGARSLTFLEFGELGGIDVLVGANVAVGAVNMSVSAANLARQVNRDAIADAKNPPPQKEEGGGLRLGGQARLAARPDATGRTRAPVFAGAGRSASIGALSVPQSWATPVEIRQLARALSTNGAGAAPVVVAEDAENPYTGMALASLAGSGMGGLAARGTPAVSTAVATPAAAKPAAKEAANPAARIAAIPTSNTAGISTAEIAEKVAATLAAMPGATVVVVPPPPASG